MMNKRWTALLGCVAVGAAALADGIVIGRLENGGVDVAAGETETITSPLEISAGGNFIKRGAGTLNFPVAASETVSNRVSYQVLAGTLNVTEDPVTAPALAVPSCVTEKAAAWFSAIDGDFITTDGSGNVVNWYDARETGVTDPGFTPTRRYMAYACADGKAGCPQTKTSFLGHNAVYFGGYAARNLGGYMQLTKTDGTKDALSFVWNVFYVHGVHNALGTVIGCSVQPGDFMLGGSTVSVSANGLLGLNYCRADAVPGLFASRYFRNGRSCDPFQEWMYQDTFECVDVDFTGNATSFDCFYSNRHVDNRFGGDYISEAIVFTNHLTETERMQVERYLMKKWNLAPASGPAPAFGIADGATAALRADLTTLTSAAATNVLPVAFKGTGEVRLEGTGTRVLAPDSFNDFHGTLDVGTATFFSRFGLFPAVSAMAGKRYVTTLNRLNSGNDVRNGLSLKTTAASAGEVEKTGPETLPFARVAPDVKRIRVREGTLSLRGAAPVTRYVANGAISATFANPNMEKVQYADPNGNRGRRAMSNGETRDGWTLASSGFTAGYVVGPLLRSGYEWGYDIPEGRQALYVFSSNGTDGYATLHTTVTFPCAGTYRVSWRTTSSIYGKASPLGYSIIFGRDFASAEVVNHAFIGVVGAPLETMRLEVPEAGTYCFGFRVDENYGAYYAVIFDDLRADQETVLPATEVVAIPNGDFEQVTTNGAAPGELTLCRRESSMDKRVDPRNQPIGWTLYQGDGWTEATVGGATVGLGFPALPRHKLQYEALFNSDGRNSNYCTFSRTFDGSCGLFQLFMANHPDYANTYAETTFTVEKAGTYYLRGKVAKWNVSTIGIDFFGMAGEVPSVRARVTAGGGTTDLGSVSSLTINPEDTLWPTSFTVAANATVTLRLDQTTPKAACLLDDFVLVRADDAPIVEDGVELIANGSFERCGLRESNGQCKNEEVWSTTVGSLSTQAISFWAYGSAGLQYTIVPFDGDVVCCVRGDSALSQTLPPMEAGIYRFRVAASTRWTGGYDENGIRVTLNDPSDGSVKYTICEFSEVTNYHAQVTFHDVTVDQPGTYALKIQGTHSDIRTGDRACSIDGLSLKRLYAAEPPSVPPEVKIDVAEGARLDLDYDGTVQVRGLSLAGRGQVGVVDATTCPGYVTGRGKLDVRPNGTIVLFR